MINTAALNISGWNRMSLDVLGPPTDATNSFYWGITKWAWDLVEGSKANGTKVRLSRIPRNRD